MLIYMSTFENTAAASLDIGEMAISRPKSWFPRARFTPCAIGAGAECVRDYEFCSLGKGLNKIEQTERAEGVAHTLADILIHKVLLVVSLRQPTGHWFSCQMAVCHWSPSVARTNEDQHKNAI